MGGDEMKPEILRKMAELADRGEPFVTAVVVGRRPPSSAQVGDRAVVTADGVFHGWLGGSCTRPTVIREARRALADGRPRRVCLSPDPEAERRRSGATGATGAGVDVFPMTCHSGGTVEIYLEPVLPAPRLLVFGPSPVARALGALGEVLGHRVTVVGGEDGVAIPDLAKALGPTGDGAATEAGSGGDLCAVVATMGEDDEASLRAALALDPAPAYVGLVASSRRFAQVRETLAAGGVAAEALDRVKSPAGLDLGGRTPEEIALSILAEIVQLRRAAAADEAEAETEAEPAEATTHAIDPICGMSVEVAGARHTAEHAGRTWYFCCGGCRERFLADPGRHASAAQGGAA